MKSGAAKIMICLLAAGAGLACPAPGHAQNAWRFGSDRDGLVTASIFSTNTLSRGASRVIDYHPVLTIGCRPNGEPRWSQSVQLKDPVSGDQSIDLTVRLDGREFSEQWALGFQKRGFSRDGQSGVARLLNARRVKFGWRKGFLSGREDADFNLAGIRDAVAKIAGACGFELP